MKIIKGILSGIYGFGVWVHNVLYDENLMHSVSVKVPTICVGNLAVGGTGKTPHVEYLISLLKDRYKIAVLSRGYKRKTKGFYMAGGYATANLIGDEPMQIHQKYPDVLLAVCENRVHAIHRLLQMHPDIECILLDDAFQHRHLKAGLNILLTAADNLFVNDHMLPLGKLRDNRSQYLRANMIVITKCPSTLRPIDKRLMDTTLHLTGYQTLFFSQIRYGELIPVFPDFAVPLPERSKSFPMVLTGVENPKPLYDYVKQQCPGAELLAFPDHHAFKPRDIELVKTAPYIITTEKDATRLQNMESYPDELKAKTYALPITVDFTEQKDAFDKRIISYIDETNRKRAKAKH